MYGKSLFLHHFRGIFKSLVATLISLGVATEAPAQTPSLDVYYYKLDPKDTFKYKWQGEAKVCNIGAFRWIVPPSTFATGGFDRNFTGYCAEIDKNITAGIVYRFRSDTLMDPHLYGLEATPEGVRSAERRATLIRELYGRYYTENKTAHPDETFSFQLCLWELTHERDPMDRPADFSLYSGEFQANYPPDQAPTYVVQAEAWLHSLTGNDAIYYENPNINGRELVRLQGLENADGIVAQDQYALRFMNGGGGSVGPYYNEGYNNGFGFGGGGGFSTIGTGITGVITTSGGAEGTGAGGPGGPLVNTTGNNISPPPPPPPPPPPVIPPPPPPFVVTPAPTGLVLGVIAVGALASRRLYLRLAHR